VRSSNTWELSFSFNLGEHIIMQIGMFSYTGLSVEQVKILRSKFHIYMTLDGRISMAGLNKSNIGTFAKAVDYVVRNI
jgi:aspartate/tyrosine/aromatic aminotransferase